MLEPIVERTIRMSRARGNAALTVRGFHLHGTDVFVPTEGELRGKPLVPVWKKRRYTDADGRWAVRHEKIHQVVKDLHAAVRQQEHILGGTYGAGKRRSGEANKVQGYAKLVNELADRLMEWKRLPPRSREAVKKDIFALSEDLAGVVNDFKEKSRNQLFRASLLRDRTGRVNPGAALARLVSAHAALNDRSAEIGTISPIIAFRRQALLFESDRHRSILADAERALNGLANASTKSSASNLQGMRVRWQRVRNGLETLRVAPHHDVAAEFDPFIQEAFAFADEGERGKAQSRFNQARATVQRHLRPFEK